MKYTLLFAVVFFVNNLNAQTHNIEIHENGRVASLLMSSSEYSSWISNDEFNNQVVRTALFKDIYQKFDDDFDFIFLILNEDAKPADLPYGQLIQVSNDVSGIGLSIFDNSGDYGSDGKLKAVMHLTRRDYLRLGPSLHELMHNWGNFGIPTESVNAPGTGLTSFSYIPHWGFTGGSSKGQLGGFSQSSLVSNGANSYTVNSFGANANGANSIPYNELELYLMGMKPISSVADFDVFTEITSLTVNDETFDFSADTRTTYTAASLEKLLGVRSPSSASSQKDFKALVIVLTDVALTTDEWDIVDDYAEKFSRTSSDLSSSYNFWEATNGLGTIEMDNLNSSTSVNETYNLTDNISLFPNPASDNITIKATNNKSLEFESITIISYLGETVYSRTISNPIGELNISLTDYSSGIYLINFKDSNNKSYVKIVVVN